MRSERQSAAKRCLDCTDIDFRHFHHCIECALGGSRVGIGNGSRQNHRCYLPRHSPLVLAPAASAFLTAIANDRVPIAIRFGLISGCHLERKRFALRECRPTVEAETGDTHYRELHGQHIAFLPRRKVPRRAVHGANEGIWKCSGVEPCRLFSTAVVPKANRVLCWCCHVTSPLRQKFMILRAGFTVLRRSLLRFHWRFIARALVSVCTITLR